MNSYKARTHSEVHEVKIPFCVSEKEKRFHVANS